MSEYMYEYTAGVVNTCMQYQLFAVLSSTTSIVITLELSCVMSSQEKIKTPLLEGSGRASSDPARSTTKKPVEMTEIVAEDVDIDSYENRRYKKKKTKGVTWSGNV